MSSILALALAWSAAVAPGEIDLEWKGRRHALDALPAKLPDDARTVVESWTDWAREHEYRFLVDDAGLLVLVCPDGDGEAEKRLALAVETAAAFERHLPAPERPEAVAASARAGEESGDADGIPEDPDGEGPIFENVTVARDEPWSYEWGAGSRPLDTGAIAVFACRGVADYTKLVEALGERRPYLARWVDETRSVLGFAIEDPLVGAFVLGADELEEWDPHGELVHRVAHLLVVRRFGTQPYWVLKGWAWWSELEIRNAIYVFPYRREWISISEHGGWDHLVRNRFEDRDEQPTIEDVTRLVRGHWDDLAAGLALSTVTCLVERRGDDFVGLLEALREAWEAGSRIDYPDGTWERDRDYRVPAAEQGAIFERVLGPKVFAELDRCFTR